MITIRNRKFTAYCDPGHGWLKVPISLVYKLGIGAEISPCSYWRGNYVFLEEDCDLSLFVRVFEDRTGNRPEIVSRHTNKQSKIRNYRYYNWNIIKQEHGK